jgi:hypothetical protein
LAWTAEQRGERDLRSEKRLTGGSFVRRIRLREASFAAVLAGAVFAAATASAAGPLLFLTNGGVRVAKGQAAEIVVGPLNLEVGEQTDSCVEVVRDGSVTATGKPTAKLAFAGEEVETECPSGSVYGLIKGVSLVNAGGGQIHVTVQSKGGIVMEAPVGKRRCAYGASTLTGGETIGPELRSVQVSAAAKLNTKYSSPGCPKTAELGAYVTLSAREGEVFETEA